MESSTSTTRLPSRTWRIGLNFSRIPASRSRWLGWMKVRVMYRDLITPSTKGICDASAKPTACGVPESGSAMTMSPSAGASWASSRPMFTRAS